MMGEAGMAEAADDQQPVGPVWIHENVAMRALDQKGGMADPSQTNLPGFEFGKNGGGSVAMAPLAGEKSREEHIGDKTVRLLPARMAPLWFHA